MPSTPTTGQQICDHYKLEPVHFMAMPAMERGLYRALYACEVLHVQEIPKYSNRGPDVERYQLAAGSGPGEPWCAAFGTCMLLDSGVKRSDLPELAASVHGWLSWAHQKGIIALKPLRGFAGLLIHSPTSGHWVWIVAVEGDNVHTVEGNTDTNGSSEGYEVAFRIRPIDHFHCFVDLSGLKS